MNSIDNNVEYMLNLPVNLKPDTAIGCNGLIKRKVLLEDYEDSKYDLTSMRVGIDIIVSPKEQGLHKSTFTSSYPKSGLGVKQCKELESFIDSNIGQEVYIAYNLIRKYGGIFPALQMISPVQANHTLFARGDNRSYGLLPYMLKA